MPILTSPRHRLLVVMVVGLIVLATWAAYIAPDSSAQAASEWTVAVAAGGSELRGDAPFALGGFKDGPASTAEFDRPVGMAAAPDGSVYIADSGNHRIRRLTVDGRVETIAGSGEAGSTDGPALQSTFRSPVDVAIAPDGSVYVVDAEAGQVRRVKDGAVTTVAGVDVAACDIALRQRKVEARTAIPVGCPDVPGQATFRDGAGPLALFNQPSSIAIGPAGELYVADSANQVIRRIGNDANVATYAGLRGNPGNADGNRDDARFFFPVDLVLTSDGDLILTEGSRVRRITSGGEVSTLAGSRKEGFDAAGYADGPGAEARFSAATGIAVVAKGGLIVSDTQNQRVRLIDEDGSVTTIAGRGGQGITVGTGNEAQFSLPVGIVSLTDGTILVADYNLNRIFRITRIEP